jgi:exodeoxyribonuclease III
MRIISWNVNGIRAIKRRGDFNWLEAYGADIYFLQETKASVDQLDDSYSITGYEAFYASSVVKKGYSGVATFSRIPFESTLYGLGVPQFDEQGRVLTHIYENIAFINVYVPNGGGRIAPLSMKLDFYDKLFSYVLQLKKEGKSIILCGDLNVAHEAIDLARPDANKTSIGFLPEERAWVDELIRAGFIDVFREKYPNVTGAYTYWDQKTRSRDRNVGWRIDYFFVSSDMFSKVNKVEILHDVYGSDHCPILLEVQS